MRQKVRLVALCDLHAVALIEDDIYADLADAAPLKPLKAWDRTGNVIHCSSFNKVLGPGLRLGWMLAGRWHARVEMLLYAQTRSVEELPQRVGATLLAGSTYERHLQRLRATLAAQRERMAEAVAASFPAGTRLSVPAGGMVLWVELPQRLSSQRLFEMALAQGIRVVPGSRGALQQRTLRTLRAAELRLTRDGADAAGRVALGRAGGSTGGVARERSERPPHVCAPPRQQVVRHRAAQGAEAGAHAFVVATVADEIAARAVAAPVGASHRPPAPKTTADKVSWALR